MNEIKLKMEAMLQAAMYNMRKDGTLVTVVFLEYEGKPMPLAVPQSGMDKTLYRMMLKLVTAGRPVKRAYMIREAWAKTGLTLDELKAVKVPVRELEGRIEVISISCREGEKRYSVMQEIDRDQDALPVFRKPALWLGFDGEESGGRDYILDAVIYR